MECPAPGPTSSDLAALQEAGLLFLGGCASNLAAVTLAMIPALEAVFYGAGAIKAMVTDAFREKGAPVCSARAADDIPVAEFTFANIIPL